MAQKVISAKDFELFFNIDQLGVALRIETGANFNASITGITEDIGALSTDEPIATENGGNTYDVSFTLQQAEAQAIFDKLVSATNGNVVHIRQLVESATITAVWNKRRNVPAIATVETYTNCTGVEETDDVERRSPETLKVWRFRARGKSRVTINL